jgi:hypothetical protein
MTTAAEQSRLVTRLAAEFAGPLSQSRDDLAHMSKLHRDFVKECFAAIDAKKVRMGGPLMGEIFPHVVAQGLKLEDSDRRVLAAAWLALYGYICIVDFELDRTGHLGGRTSIAASALLGWGIATVGRYTSGTPFADTFLDNINRAFAGQYQDILARADGNADRGSSDVDKNRAVVAAIAGFCAAAREQDDRLIRATETILKGVQILDDLQDVREDHEENNLTAFVRIVRESAASAASLTDTQLYRLVLSDPRAKAALLRAAEAIEQSVLILDANRDQAIITYFCELRDGVLDIVHALDDYQRTPASISEPELMRRIEHIATGT